MNIKSGAILVISCDKYSDLWKPFFYLFWKNWPDCPYKVYLGSNTIKYSKDKRVKTILSGPDVDWSTSFKSILGKIAEKNLLVWPEDAFIISRVNMQRVQKAFDFFMRNKAKNIHCRPPPVADNVKTKDFISSFEKGAPYRVNLEGFWDKSYLEKILIPGETSWNFEIMGSYRTSYEDGFYCIHKPLFDFLHLVEKGKFIRDNVIYCQKQGAYFDLKKRQMLSLSHDFISYLIRTYVDFMFRLDWRIRLKIMNLLRKLLVSY